MSSFADRPLLFGHRGARRRFPENTLPSFIAAIEDGANALELDVQVSKDGVVVVMHDDDGARMCGVADRVDATAYKDLAAWDAGKGFVDRDNGGGNPFAQRGLRIPKLEDVVRALPGVPINIDLKPADPKCAAVVVDVVKRLQVEDRVLLTSFHDDVLAAVRDVYDGRVGFSKSDVYQLRFLPLAVLRRRRPRGQRLQIPVRAGPVFLDGAGFIDKMHALDIRVDYWVINDVAEGQRLLQAGADGLMSDVPKTLAPLLSRPVSAI